MSLRCLARRILLVASLVVLTFLPRLVEAKVDTTREDQLLKTALEYIEKNRKGTTNTQFIDEITGRPVSGVEVHYQQTSHDFIFGTFLVWDPARVQQLGLEWSGDIWLSWAEIEPTEGMYLFSRTDDHIRWLRQNEEVRLFARFSGLFLDWNYVEVPRPPSYADLDHIDDPAVFARYKDLVYKFVFNVATHYRGTIQAYVTQWEINWPGHAVSVSHLSQRPLWTVQQAVELDEVVSRAIRDADPNAIIMLGTSTTWKGPSENDVDAFQFTKLCLQAGVDVDMVAFEFYPSEGRPAFFYDYVRKLAKLGKPVFIEETGYPSVKPNVDESWLKSWKWHVFDEHVQALWYRYVFTFAFGMREATGVSILSIRDMEYTAAYHSFTDPAGLFTVTWQPKESAAMLRELIANFTMSGTARTDDEGTATLRGFAGNYTVDVEGYEPVAVHISEGRVENLTITVSREKTPEYNDALATVTSAQSALASLDVGILQSPEAKRLAGEAAEEYELAVASLDKWELDDAKTHAERSKQLVNEALQAEAKHQRQLRSEHMWGSTQLLSIVAAGALVVGLSAVLLNRNRHRKRKEKLH